MGNTPHSYYKITNNFISSQDYFYDSGIIKHKYDLSKNSINYNDFLGKFLNYDLYFNKIFYESNIERPFEKDFIDKLKCSLFGGLTCVFNNVNFVELCDFVFDRGMYAIYDGLVSDINYFIDLLYDKQHKQIFEISSIIGSLDTTLDTKLSRIPSLKQLYDTFSSSGKFYTNPKKSLFTMLGNAGIKNKDDLTNLYSGVNINFYDLIENALLYFSANKKLYEQSYEKLYENFSDIKNCLKKIKSQVSKVESIVDSIEEFDKNMIEFLNDLLANQKTLENNQQILENNQQILKGSLISFSNDSDDQYNIVQIDSKLQIRYKSLIKKYNKLFDQKNGVMSNLINEYNEIAQLFAKLNNHKDILNKSVEKYSEIGNIDESINIQALFGARDINDSVSICKTIFKNQNKLITLIYNHYNTVLEKQKAITSKWNVIDMYKSNLKVWDEILKTYRSVKSRLNTNNLLDSFNTHLTNHQQDIITKIYRKLKFVIYKAIHTTFKDTHEKINLNQICYFENNTFDVFNSKNDGEFIDQIDDKDYYDNMKKCYEHLLECFKSADVFDSVFGLNNKKNYNKENECIPDNDYDCVICDNVKNCLTSKICNEIFSKSITLDNAFRNIISK